MFWNIISILSMYEPLENIYFHILAENDFRIESLWSKYVHSFLFYFFIGKLSKMIEHLFKTYLLSTR